MRSFAVLGLCASALATSCRDKPVDPAVTAEIAARGEFAKRLLLEEDAGTLLGISSSPDIMFEEGFSQILYDPQRQWRAHPFRWIGQNAHVRLRPHPGKAMRLHIQGWASANELRTKPQVALYIDGERLKLDEPVEHEHFWIDVDVPPQMLRREWVDLNIRLNTVAWHWDDPPMLAVANIYNFTWTDLP
jgi:hypothetical protein